MEQFAAEEIGSRIALARQRADGMTQERLADLIGVSKRSVQDYEAGLTIPWKHLREIAKVTQADVDWLLHGSPEEEGLGVRELLVEIDERVRRIEDLLQDDPPLRRVEP